MEDFWDTLVSIQYSGNTGAFQSQAVAMYFVAWPVVLLAALAIVTFVQRRLRIQAELHRNGSHIPQLGTAPLTRWFRIIRGIAITIAALAILVILFFYYLEYARPLPPEIGLAPIEVRENDFKAGPDNPEKQALRELRWGELAFDDDLALSPDQAQTMQENAENKRDKLIVFIHGWTGDQSTFEQFPTLVQADPLMQTYSTYLLHYPTLMVRRNLRVPDIATALRNLLLRDLAINQYEKIYFVAHSMGGLIARQTFIYNQLGENKLPLRGIVSLGSPFAGTPLASYPRLLGLGDELTSDMSPTSTYIRDLQTLWLVADAGQSAMWKFCFASVLDKVVAVESAVAGCGAYNEKFATFGHIDLVKPIDLDDERYKRVISTILLDAKFN
ncbi:esterase/lipase family protein [Oricola indica]|jgi:pimeloyl-ACP methyl ester carboxylesterase/predicted secreted protein|uniref:esterase/lipase family protein n=1 Tax=Oricola indica TaxID=2872591 RepID=UPI001CBDA099|nr:alpha/beta fold hydrolase [Oricola indica]